MSRQLIEILKAKIDELNAYGDIDAETRRNSLKEELQFYVLNFIYHHPEYSNWIMYGGSALRIIHGLNRMSVDLDFEIDHDANDDFLETLKSEILKYFLNNYDVKSDFLTISKTNNRGLILKFHAGNLITGHASEWIHAKIDLNRFIAPKTVTEHRPISHNQLSFVILTYNMSALMASKIAAIMLRGTRGVGKALYNEKGRDIYDLLWYMGNKVVPDLDYLKSKKVDEAKDLRVLFDKITIKMNKVDEDNLKQDLSPLFTDSIYIDNWLKNWRTSYLHLLEGYKINVVSELERIAVYQDFRSDNFYFSYFYNTEDNLSVRITYIISDYWIEFKDGDISIGADKKIANKIEFSSNGVSSNPASIEKINKYATLFSKKTEDYLKKTNRVMLGDNITTKLIRMTADNLNPKEQILLNKSALISCELEDLLK